MFDILRVGVEYNQPLLYELNLNYILSNRKQPIRIKQNRFLTLKVQHDTKASNAFSSGSK